MRCPNPDCSESVSPKDRYCEACGVFLPPPGAEAWSGGEAGSLAAWIPQAPPSGGRARVASRGRVIERDRVEVSFPDLAGVSDRGLRRRSNEDAMALARVDGQGTRILVVCDGVATSTEPASASQAAARAALAYLADAVQSDQPDLVLAMRWAVGTAHRVVSDISERIGASDDPPASTLVAALLKDGEATIGWIGDSRAYFFDATGGWQLTRDDSWATEQVQLGLMSEEEATADPRAHGLTAWLGGDQRPPPEPSVVTFGVPAPGCLVLCTDGLWNYAPTVGRLHELMLRFPADDPLEVARELTDFARTSGGEDNITVVVAFV